MHLFVNRKTVCLNINDKLPFSDNHILHLSFSDIDDGGEVEENIYHNFALNGLSRVPHIPHTWGTGA